MPLPDRTNGRRPPLEGIENVNVQTVSPDGIKVYAAPQYMVFIERMWHGDYQQVPVDPENIPKLIEALQQAMPRANADDVLYVEETPGV